MLIFIAERKYAPEFPVYKDGDSVVNYHDDGCSGTARMACGHARCENTLLCSVQALISVVSS